MRDAFRTLRAIASSQAPSLAARRLARSLVRRARYARRAGPKIGDEHRVVAILKCRNESLLLPFLLDYYRGLGIGGFIALDDGSTDGTWEFLEQQPDVELYALRPGGFAWKCDIINSIAMSSRWHGRWILALDADELLVHPLLDGGGGLDALLDLLESEGQSSLWTPMIDLHPASLGGGGAYRAGQDFRDLCFWHDCVSSYSLARGPKRLHFRGGVRHRVFYADQRHSPEMSKCSLFRGDNFTGLDRNVHTLYPAPRNFPKFAAALLHFKFLGDFGARVHRAVSEQSYFNQSAEYKVIQDKLAGDMDSELLGARSVRFEGAAPVCEALQRRLDALDSSPALS